MGDERSLNRFLCLFVFVFSLIINSGNSSAEERVVFKVPGLEFEEQKDQREIYTKTFKRSDGGTSIQLGAYPLHYSDEKNGTWHDIDPSIQVKDGFLNISNVFQTHMPAVLGADQPIILQFKGSKIRWRPKRVMVRLKNGEEESIGLLQPSEGRIVEERRGLVVYSGLFPGIDFSVQVSAGTLAMSVRVDESILEFNQEEIDGLVLEAHIDADPNLLSSMNKAVNDGADKTQVILHFGARDENYVLALSGGPLSDEFYAVNPIKNSLGERGQTDAKESNLGGIPNWSRRTHTPDFLNQLIVRSFVSYPRFKSSKDSEDLVGGHGGFALLKNWDLVSRKNIINRGNDYEGLLPYSALTIRSWADPCVRTPQVTGGGASWGAFSGPCEVSFNNNRIFPGFPVGVFHDGPNLSVKNPQFADYRARIWFNGLDRLKRHMKKYNNAIRQVNFGINYNSVHKQGSDWNKERLNWIRQFRLERVRWPTIRSSLPTQSTGVLDKLAVFGVSNTYANFKSRDFYSNHTLSLKGGGHYAIDCFTELPAHIPVELFERRIVGFKYQGFHWCPLNQRGSDGFVAAVNRGDSDFGFDLLMRNTNWILIEKASVFVHLTGPLKPVSAFLDVKSIDKDGVTHKDPNWIPELYPGEYFDYEFTLKDITPKDSTTRITFQNIGDFISDGVNPILRSKQQRLISFDLSKAQPTATLRFKWDNSRDRFQSKTVNNNPEKFSGLKHVDLDISILTSIKSTFVERKKLPVIFKGPNALSKFITKPNQPSCAGSFPHTDFQLKNLGDFGFVANLQLRGTWSGVLELFDVIPPNGISTLPGNAFTGAYVFSNSNGNKFSPSFQQGETVTFNLFPSRLYEIAKKRALAEGLSESAAKGYYYVTLRAGYQTKGKKSFIYYPPRTKVGENYFICRVELK
ncbi:hypothetical protein NBRC116602_15480 [Hyphomicrobiales bacterium 4NK60-0047b]